MKAFKKLLSLTLSAALLTAQPLSNAHAQGNAPPDEAYSSQLMDESDVRELLELAFSLGALEDHLDIANHAPSEGDTEPEAALRWFIDNAYNTEMTDSLIPIVGGGVCYGISLIEVLTHNGVISPSDIVEGAEHLSDIQRCVAADNAVAAYQAIQLFYENDFIAHSQMTNSSFAEQIDDLIATAERCMAESRYFLISYHTANSGHAVAGIGITDGSWEFDGVTYDKCVLTLDSNAQTEDGIPIPYHPSSNIYINTDSHTLFIPSYKDNESMNDVVMLTALDNDTILNYRGMIAPSSSTSFDFTDTIALGLGYEKMKTDYEVLVKRKDGSEYILGDNEENFAQKLSLMHYPEGNEFYISAKGHAGWTPLSSRVIIKDLSKNLVLNAQNDDVNYVIKDSFFSIDAAGNRRLEFGAELMLNEGYYPFSPYYYWDFNGYTDDNVDIQIAENGIIIGGDGKTETSIFVAMPYLNEDGSRTGNGVSADIMAFTAEGRVYAEMSESGMLTLKLDPDRDGIYDKEVEKGDVNCDGLKDSTDASLILYNNAQKVDRYNTYLDTRYADVNGDGLIDAADASLILSENAERSGIAE